MGSKPRICVDFDGTIWDGKQIIEGCIQALTALRKVYSIAIYSARATEQERKGMINILNLYHIPYDEILGIKPQYEFMIDDKAIRFEGDWSKIIK